MSFAKVGRAASGLTWLLTALVWLCAASSRAQPDAGTEPSPSENQPDGTESAAESEPEPETPEAEDSDRARDADIFGESSDEDPGPESDTDDVQRDADIFGESPDEDPGPESDTDDVQRDADIFGEGESPRAPEAEQAGGSDRDTAILGDPDALVRLEEEVAPQDPLTLGGLLYLRAQSFILQGQDVEDWSLTAPELAQIYFDVRPNPRVRGYMMLRLQFDPTLPTSEERGVGTGTPLAPGGSTNGTQSLSDVLQPRTRDVRFVLDQLWINFDIHYKAFVTVGKQHDRWGTGRFWMPTDYLHLTNRNPIDVFDSRAGTNMVKVHIPVESLAWNFYGYALTEAPVQATNLLSRVAGAARAEFVFGRAELGLGVFARRGSKPRYAADLSFGLWDFDFYGELALRDASEVDRVGYEPDAPLPEPDSPPSWQTPAETALLLVQQAVDARYPVTPGEGMRAQAVGGVTYSRRYDDDDVFTLGAEYFYNGLGYASSDRYLGLILPHSEPLQNAATFFYLGEHYLAVFASLPSPFAADLHTFTLSTLGNLSDRSFISRLDYWYTLLTHLRLELFVAVHYGQRTGEFRFGIDSVQVGELALSQPPSLIDLGVALRLQF